MNSVTNRTIQYLHVCLMTQGWLAGRQCQMEDAREAVCSVTFITHRTHPAALRRPSSSSPPRTDRTNGALASPEAPEQEAPGGTVKTSNLSAAAGDTHEEASTLWREEAAQTDARGELTLGSSQSVFRKDRSR